MRTEEKPVEAQAEIPKNKHELTADLLKDLLAQGEVPAAQIKDLMRQHEIGEKTLQEVKSDLGIKSVRRMKKWYWRMPGVTGAERQE